MTLRKWWSFITKVENLLSFMCWSGEEKAEQFQCLKPCRLWFRIKQFKHCPNTSLKENNLDFCIFISTFEVFFSYFNVMPLLHGVNRVFFCNFEFCCLVSNLTYICFLTFEISFTLNRKRSFVHFKQCIPVYFEFEINSE